MARPSKKKATKRKVGPVPSWADPTTASGKSARQTTWEKKFKESGTRVKKAAKTKSLLRQKTKTVGAAVKKKSLLAQKAKALKAHQSLLKQKQKALFKSKMPKYERTPGPRKKKTTKKKRGR